MARRLAAVMAITASLLLGGCGADYGVDQHGNTVKAEQVDGHWLVLNYWAEWCGPCRTEIPELNAAAKQWAADGIKVVGVNFDGLQGADLKQAADTLGIDFTVLAQDPAERYDLPRSEAVKKIWDYIKANGLQDAQNKRAINADEKLRAVFGKDQVTMFELAGIVGKHLG